MPDHQSAYQKLYMELRDYTADDYLTPAPYEKLKEFAGNHVMRYIQFLHILIDDAKSKGVEKETVMLHSDPVQVSIAPAWAVNYLQYITRQGQATPDDGLVHVWPLMCGTGKSSAISQMISQRILNHLRVTGEVETPAYDEPPKQEDYGIMIVTDSVERARDYLNPGKQRYNAQALIDHPELVTIMTRENLQEARMTMNHTPALVITTQRYFKLSSVELENFLTWDHGRRDLIVIDEQPGLLKTVTISNTALSLVRGMLADMIPYKPEEEEDKDWCIAQWQKVEKRVSEKLKELERRPWNRDHEHPNVYCYYTFPEGDAVFTEDDERFWSFVNRYDALLSEPYWTLLATEQLLYEGGVYCSNKLKTRYENDFGVVLNLRSKLLDIGAKVIIYDGTGDISPDYDDERFVVEKESAEALRRDLSNMTVKFIDVNTSKTHMAQDGMHMDLAGMVTDLENRYAGENGAIFTYEVQEPYLRRLVEERGLAGQMLIQHFGAIRGSNVYRGLAHIAQIGLFSRTPLDYLCMALELAPEKLEELKALEFNAANAWVQDYTFNDEGYHQTQTQMVLADTEQNLFRGTIRDAQCTELYHYYVYCRKASHGRVFEAMKARYPECRIEWEPMPLDMRLNKIRSSRRNSVAKKIVAFYDSLSQGTEFTMQDVQRELGITQNQIKEARKNNADLDELFRVIKIDGRIVYRKP